MKHKQNLSDSQKKKRILFSNGILKNGIDGSRVIFSDESRFVIGSSKIWTWRRRGDLNENLFHKTNKFPSSVMIFGAIGLDYKSGIVLIKSTVDADILRDSGVLNYMALPESCNLIFQHNGASCHLASTNFIRCHCSLH